MKRIWGLILTATMVFVLAACGAKEEAPVSMDLVGDSQQAESSAPTMAPSTLGLEGFIQSYFENMPDHLYMISAADFVEMVNNESSEYTILDIRRSDDYEAGHIVGAVNLPWGTAISDNLENIPSDKPLFVYCYTGQTAGQAVMTLNLAGFNARSVSLGWNLGLSKLDNLDSVTTTDATTLGGSVTLIDEDIQEAVDGFYQALSDAQGSKFVNNIVTEEALNEFLESGDESIYVLSTRRPADYAKGHIEGAANLPFGKDMFAGFESLPKDKKIIAYCYTGQTAGQATAALRLMGYDVASLYGGMGTPATAPRGWANAGYLVVSEATAKVEALYQSLPEHINMISASAFIELMAAGEEMTIIDIRSPQDYEAGHLRGAYNIPWGIRLAEEMAAIPSDKPVFIYCYTGQTAGQALVTMNMSGLNTRSISLGWNLGLSKVEGIDAYTETTTNALVSANREISEPIQVSITSYYESLEAAKEGDFRNHILMETQLKEWIDQGEASYVLVSTRRPDDYNAGHIQGAINIPFGSDMVDALKALPKDQKIVLYCYTGQTAGQATALMRILGYDAVSLRGGMGTAANAPQGWSNNGYPLVTE